MKNIGYILLFLSVVLEVNAQQADSLCISLGLKDAQTGEVLENGELIVKTDEKAIIFQGKINHEEKICWKNAYNGALNIVVNIENYVPIDTIITIDGSKNKLQNEKKRHVNFFFDFSGQIVEGVDINADHGPQVRFGSERLSVSDYVILGEKEMILLTYPQRLNKDCELIWLKNDRILGRRVYMKATKGLITDYQNNSYLKAVDGTYRLSLSSNIGLRAINEQELEQTILPILDTLGEERVYFSNYNKFYPAFDYYMVDPNDTSYVKVHHLEDELMMEQYRSEYKWADVRTKLWAWDQEAATGIDREVWVGANIFTQTIYYDPPLGDFFLMNDKLLVFDYYNDQLYFFDAWNCAKKDSCTIDFHKDARKSGWKKTVLQDPLRDELYTVYDEAGYTEIVHINKHTGALGERQRLQHRYVENIKIHDGKIYYIYRPFESPQKKYLYTESIRRDLK